MSTAKFINQLQVDSKAIAGKMQIHFLAYTPAYYKYSKNNKKFCQFDFPKLLIATSFINHNTIIQLR